MTFSLQLFRGYLITYSHSPSAVITTTGATVAAQPLSHGFVRKKEEIDKDLKRLLFCIFLGLISSPSSSSYHDDAMMS
ncbi:hypothetical protein L1987_42156 [Smallanthus sonchifolius]|uniref:Uncharacterized protein n=1 Tax=Smallanthus sonchifolius TaxID=185202 RepID=A0ACB9GWI9_9ASTR|nr:hypothetical protein L1987_42156 [Smallanthus sonchifolius]